jgi:pimeloyl-ACP methyl ester carboxylesterase
VGFTLGTPPEEGASAEAATTGRDRYRDRASEGEGDGAPAATEGTGDDAAGRAGGGARVEEDGCRFEEPEGYEVRCGWLVVPEDRDQPGSDTIRLHYGIFHREGAEVADDPIVYLDGGPGGKALEGATFDFDGRFGDYTERHDVVVFDQRGTGFSEPALDCPDVNDLFRTQLDDTSPVAEQLAAQQDALADCAEDLRRDGADLAQYNSVESAADVAALRTALGYDEVNLFGVSYGTRLAQTVMREHPKGIRSVILDSTLPIAADLLAELPDNTKAAFDHFFAQCAADAGCNGRYPNLEDRYWARVKALDAKPVEVTVRDFLSGEVYPATFNGTDLVDLTFQALYDESLFITLPSTVEGLEKGDPAGLVALGGVSITNLPFISLGMHLSVKCNEDVSFAEPAEVAAAEKEHPEFSGSFQGQIVDGTGGFETCRIWQAGRAPAEEDQPVRSELPVLVLSGGFDPITPERWAREVMETLPNGQLVAFPTMGHGVGLSGGCPAEIVSAFLEAPDADAPTGCVAGMPKVRWIPGDASVTLEPFEAAQAGAEFSGVRPREWEEQQPGLFGRGASATDPTLLLVQAVPGVGLEALTGLVASQFPFNAEPQSQPDITAGGSTWKVYRTQLEASAGGGDVDLALATQGRATVLVMLVSAAAERDKLRETVFLPALDAARYRG